MFRDTYAFSLCVYYSEYSSRFRRVLDKTTFLNYLLLILPMAGTSLAENKQRKSMRKKEKALGSPAFVMGGGETWDESRNVNSLFFFLL